MDVIRIGKIAVLLLAATILFGCRASNSQELNLDVSGDGSEPKQTLTIGLGALGESGYSLAERIQAFGKEHPDIEIKYMNIPKNYRQIKPSVMGLEDRVTAPDLIEVTHNQMLNMFHHGNVESLDMNEPQLQELVIKAPDGTVVGIKSKINPLIVYYNQDIFDVMGLEQPSSDWSWDMFDQTIATLQGAGHNVHIMLSPFTLEWLTMSRYGGRISDPHRLKFGGYLDGEAAVRAAEWFAWVGTKREDYDVPQKEMFTMPYVLINDKAALVIDYAHRVHDRYHYESIIERNDRINIAPLPGGYDTINPAQMMGLSIMSSSPNKDAAMKLLRYLTKDSEVYKHDIASYSMQGGGSGGDWIDPVRASIILQEMGRSVPASLYMSDVHLHAMNSVSGYPLLREIIDGGSARDALEQYAEQLDVEVDSFWDDPEAYWRCISDGRDLCVR